MRLKKNGSWHFHAALYALAALLLFPCARPSQAAQVRMIGVQLAVDTSIYRSRASFERRLDEAVSDGLRSSGRKPGEEVIVVLPEHIGTFLAFIGESSWVLTAPTRSSVVARAFLGNPDLLRYHLVNVIRTRTWKAFQTYFALTSLLRYKAFSMWRTYTEVSSALAKKHKIILVAGSISSPRPEEMGKPLAPVYGTSAVFSTDGSMLGITRKVHPVMEEVLFLTPAPAEELRPINTPAGRIGILICSDSWYQDTYERLKDSDFLAVPSLGEGGLEIFGKSVKSFDGKSFEEDPDPKERTPTVHEAWFKNGLVGRIASTSARGGVQPFLTGRLWDMETAGPEVSLKRRAGGFELKITPSVKGSDTFVAFSAANPGAAR